MPSSSPTTIDPMTFFKYPSGHARLHFQGRRMLCALTNTIPPDTVWATFLLESTGPVMYLHTCPELDHEASNIDFDDFDYGTVAREFGILVTRRNFVDRALGRWSWTGVLELETLGVLGRRLGVVDRWVVDEGDEEVGEAVEAEEEEVVEAEEEQDENEFAGNEVEEKQNAICRSLGPMDLTGQFWGKAASMAFKRRVDSVCGDSSDNEMEIEDEENEAMETNHADTKDTNAEAESDEVMSTDEAMSTHESDSSDDEANDQDSDEDNNDTDNEADNNSTKTMTFDEAIQIQANYNALPAGLLSREDHDRWKESVEQYGEIDMTMLLGRNC